MQFPYCDCSLRRGLLRPFFFCNDPAPAEIYTLSLHDALPICRGIPRLLRGRGPGSRHARAQLVVPPFERRDRKSTRLNSSHVAISYAVFCLKKKISQMCETSACTFCCATVCRSRRIMRMLGSR